MHVYNVIQAAKYIGCDPKTVRRWLKRGLLTAERTDRGWLAIPGGQVEYAKIKWEEEQAKFARPWLSKESLPEQPREDMDIIRRVEALEQKVAELEQALSNASLHVPAQPQAPLYRYVVDREEASKSQPQKSFSVPSELPQGSIHFAEFAARHGVPRQTFDRHITKGIQGDKVEAIERPKPGRPEHSEKFLSTEQQEAAIQFWIRHNVKFT